MAAVAVVAVVAVHGHGRARVGVVVGVTAKRVQVAWTTPTAVKEAKEGGHKVAPVVKWYTR